MRRKRLPFRSLISIFTDENQSPSTDSPFYPELQMAVKLKPVGLTRFAGEMEKP